MRCSDCLYSNKRFGQTICERYPNPIDKSPDDSCGEFTPDRRSSFLIGTVYLDQFTKAPLKTKLKVIRRKCNLKLLKWWTIKGRTVKISLAIIAHTIGLFASALVIYNQFFG